MLAKNCFLLGHASSFNSDKDFIEAISAKLLAYLDEKCLMGTTIIYSVPGSGKSTLLKMFTPSVLQDIQDQHENSNYKDLYQLLMSIGALGDNGVNVIGIISNMAEDSYRLIEDIYENGRAISIFFALLSLRTIRKMIIAICDTLRINQYECITFKNIPEEYKVMCGDDFNGKELYDWALSKEREICLRINNMDDGNFVNPLFSSLSVFRLLETGNILVNGRVLDNKTLIMLDDCHTLSRKQRDLLRSTIFNIKSNSVIWMAERKSTLTAKELLGEEGSYNRYYRTINLDETIDEKNSPKMWEDVSSRRVKMTYPTETLGTFLDGDLYIEEKDKWQKISEKIRSRVKIACDSKGVMYKDIYDHANNKSTVTIREDHKAIIWKVLEILIARKENDPQQSFLFVPAYSAEEFEEQLKVLKNVAEFYICREFKLPLYYGTDSVAKIASRNIYQYIEFAGALFDLRIALDISPRRKKKSVSLKEQDQVLKKLADTKWKMLDTQFVDSVRIKSLLSSIAQLGEKSLLRGTASYAGGAFTGIGLKESVFNEICNDDKYSDTVEVLRKCLSNNFLMKKKIMQNNESKVVFYLNRWICIRHNLPLSYGGWKPITADWLIYVINKTA